MVLSRVFLCCHRCQRSRAQLILDTVASTTPETCAAQTKIGQNTYEDGGKLLQDIRAAFPGYSHLPL